MANPFILVSSLIGMAAAMMVIEAKDQVRSRKRSESIPGTCKEPLLERLQSGWTAVQCEDVETFSNWLSDDETGLPARPGEEPSLGSHLLVELFGCSEECLKEEDYVGSAMRDAAKESCATVVAESFHEFRPYGVSGAVIIQESHYTIHTWPEHRYAAVDLFYCGGGVLVHRAVQVLKERFKPTRIKFLVVRRGLCREVDSI